VVAIWSAVDEEWATAQLSPSSEEEGHAWETEYERDSGLIGWLPFPSLPNVKALSRLGGQWIGLNGKGSGFK